MAAASPTDIGQDVAPISHPDLKFCVWPKAFDRSVQTIVDAIFEGRTLIELYESSSEFANVMVTNVVKPQFHIDISPGKLTWKLDNARFIIRADEMALRTVKSFVKVVSGSFTVDILVTPTAVMKEPSFHVRINLSCASSPDFQLTDIASADASSSPDDTDKNEGRKSDGYIGVDADFKHTSAEINFCLNAAAGDSDKATTGKRSCSNGEPSSKRQRKAEEDDRVESTDRLINEEICNCLLQTFADLVMERLNGGLPVSSSSLHDEDDDDDDSCSNSDGWMYEFSETSMPEFQTGFLMSNHLSAIRYAEETIRGPAPVFPFPEPQNSGRMLTVFISNSVFNAVGCYLHQQNILNYTLTQDDFAAAAAAPQPNSSANNTSGSTRHLSDCFPQFSVKYPGATVDVNMTSTEAPTTTFSGDSLRVKLNGSATFRAHLPDTNVVVDILATKVIVEAVVPVALGVGTLVGQVTDIWPSTITYVENEKNPVSNEVLNEVLNQIAKQFLREKFNAIAQKGIPLPRPLIPGAVQLQNTEVRSEENYLRVDTDLEFRS